LAPPWTGVDIDEALLDAAVSKAASLGATYAEARYHKTSGYNFTLHNNNLLGLSHILSTGIAIRVIVDGALGFSATDSLDEASIAEAVEKAVKSARSTASLVRTRLGMDDSRLGKARYSVVEEKPGTATPVEDVIRDVQDLMNSISIQDLGINVASTLFNLSYTVEEKLVVTSDGAFVESRVPRLGVYYSITATREGERANRWNQIGGTGGLELIGKLRVKENIEDDLDSLKIYLVEAGRPPKGKLDVVLGPEVVGLAVHESAGHPSEADRLLGREAAQAGLTYRRRLRPGERIGSSHATVIDDPGIPGSYGFYLYDDEGVPVRPRYLIREGVLDEYLHNRETAYLMGTKSNAAARAKEWWAEPIVRMANTYFAPGDYRFEELVEDVKHGVYIKKYMEWNIDDYRWVARYVGLEAYEIVNGRLGRPVKNPALEVNSREFYSNVDAAGRDLQFFAGTCGKGEPAQGVPVWFGGPHIRLREVRIL